MKPISTHEFTPTIGFWTPYLKSKRGNSTTAKRIIEGLKSEGYRIEVFAYEEEEWNSSAKARMGAVDVHHILHFYRFSMWKKRQSYELDKPFLVTSGGTDVHQNLLDATQRQVMEGLMMNAFAITVFTEEAAKLVGRAYPEVSPNIHVIPQSVWFPAEHGRNEIMHEEGWPNVLLPAGLRKVKDIFFVFEALKVLHDRYPMLKFTIVGEALEEDVLDHVKTVKEEHPWVHYINGVPLESMHQLYEWSDLVINTSVSEGQPLALMEAMFLGKPVMARRNAGNCSLIEDGVDGILFENEVDFKDCFIRVAENGQLYRNLSGKAMEKAKNEFSIKREIKQYEQLYLSGIEEQ